MDDFEQFSNFAESQKPKETPKFTDIRESFSGNGEYDDFFNMADKNDDNKLTPTEAKAVPELDTKKEFKLADENKDKLISFDEYLNQLPEEKWNAIDKAPNEKEKYNAFSKTLNDYYNEYVDTLDPNDPHYDDKVNLAKDDAEEQIRKAGYWNYNPATGKDYIVNPDFDPERGSIAKDENVKKNVKSTLDRAITSHNVDEMAELLNDVLPNLPLYTDTERAEKGRQMQDTVAGIYEGAKNYNRPDKMEYFENAWGAVHKIDDTGEIWQEGVSKDLYDRLSQWSFEELYELSKKSDHIKWKKLANAVARSETTDKDKQKERSKEWLKDWKDYVSKVDSASKVLNELSNNHIGKDEVEQVLYRDYVEKAKKEKAPKEQKPKEEDKKPIQITEKTNVRERIIEEAARHIMEHGKSLPKELKKSVQEISAKFEPFKFEHKMAKENDAKPLTDYSPNEDNGLGIEFGQAETESNIPNGSVMQSGFGSSGGSSGGAGLSRQSSSPTSGSTAGGMSLPDLPEPKFSFGGGFDGIGEFTSKKHPINIKMPKGKKTGKAMEFPDLSPDVEQHNEMEGIPDVTKAARPIIKNGLYQDKNDKVDNDIYSKIIEDVIDEYKDWESTDNEYLREIPQLNITLYYDGVSQPKIKVPEMGGKQNISTLLRREGGREILENLYNYLEEEK